MKQAIFFVTHVFNQEIEERYIKLKSELGGKYDIFLTGTNLEIIPKIYVRDFIEINIDEFYNTCGTVFGNGGYLGNCHITPYLINKKRPGYSYYWFIEFDVIFTGNWNLIFDKIINDDSDLICTHIRSYENDLIINKKFGKNSNFTFWESLVIPKKYNSNKMIRAFLPFYRISNKGIAIIKTIIDEKWLGHFEILLPSALLFNDMKISQFGGDSEEYTPRDRKKLYYNTYLVDAYIGEFRYRPPVLFHFKKNTLYHPVKKIPIIKSIKFRYRQLIIFGKILYFKIKKKFVNQ